MPALAPAGRQSAPTTAGAMSREWKTSGYRLSEWPTGLDGLRFLLRARPAPPIHANVVRSSHTFCTRRDRRRPFPRERLHHPFGGTDPLSKSYRVVLRARAAKIEQFPALKMISANAPLSEILTKLVLLIEEQSPGMLCSVLLLSADGNHIEHGAAPSLAPEYVKAVNGEPIGPKNGSCGTAMYRGKPVIVTDIFEDPLWEDYRDLAAASRLRACWSTPILTDRGKVLGSFAMYYREPRVPTGEESRLTSVATYIAGIAIERHRHN